jgi:hypothetical protein
MWAVGVKRRQRFHIIVFAVASKNAEAMQLAKARDALPLLSAP